MKPSPQLFCHSFEIQAGMFQSLDPPPSRPVRSAIEDYVLSKEPWNCWHTRLPWFVTMLPAKNLNVS